ncbi:hypothetical protein KR018_005379 [Drosophila ironensis]|nr:hypothetical protein KR018_005379 [Drosophila ironensis]
MWSALCTIAVIVASVGPPVEGRYFSPSRSLVQLNLDEYPTYEGVIQYLEYLALTFSHRVYLTDVGRSYEGRELRLATISNGDGRPGKRVIFVDAALHAREWLCPIAALYVIHQLVVMFEDNSYLLADYDWVVLPLANPDGYEYSRNMDTWWRNTRTPNIGACTGTNLNRNFDIAWGEGIPQLRDPCDENYAGQSPFSESESRAVRDIMHELVSSQRGVMYLSLHTANRSIFYPWVYAGTPTPNHQEHEEMARFAANRIKWGTGTIIKPKQAFQYGGSIGGTSLDYAYNLGFPLSFVFEMSGKGRNGIEYKFFPPPSQIRGLVMECWLGIQALAEKAIEKYPPSRPINQFKTPPTVNSGASDMKGFWSMFGWFNSLFNRKYII